MIYAGEMKRIHNESGFSLVELMVAAGLLAVIALGFFNLSDRVVKTENKMLDLIEINEITMQLRYNFSNPIGCHSSLGFLRSEEHDAVILPSQVEEVINERGELMLLTKERIGRITPTQISVKEVDLPLDTEIGQTFKTLLTLFFYFDGSGRSPMIKNKVVRISMPVWLKYLDEQDLDIKKDGRKIYEFLGCLNYKSGSGNPFELSYLKFACKNMGGEFNKFTGICQKGEKIYGSEQNKQARKRGKDIREQIEKHLGSFDDMTGRAHPREKDGNLTAQGVEKFYCGALGGFYVKAKKECVFKDDMMRAQKKQMLEQMKQTIHNYDVDFGFMEMVD